MVKRPLRLLWVMPYLPWPTTSGGKLRQYHLLRCLAARGHRITLLVQSKTALDAETAARLEPLLEKLVVLPRRPLRSARTLWHGLVSPLPLLATVNGHAPALSQQLEQLLEEDWDVIQVEHSYTYQPCRGPLRRRRAPLVLTEHNVESQLAAVTYARLPWPLRSLAGHDRRRYRRWERKVLGEADHVVAMTADDARVFAAMAASPVAVVVNGSDTGALAVVQPDLHAARALFVGNFEYAPNVDAVQWLLDEVMPRAWAQAPRLRIALCGHALPPQWAQHWRDPRIDWIGYVPELAVEQARSSLFVAPLRDGGGSKLKVIEAMAAGLPLVATAQAVSGLAVSDGVHCRLAADAEGLARAMVELQADPAQAARLAVAARGYVCEQHDWQRSADQLEAVYAGVCG